ncbi:helix-turn-helix psq domain [Holotrichia oblita]|uniref:Helix-turn-helix psq domain n=1 Tax=Holotrichia oblita TaxID=644536 RepID=A0ACB9SV27_HOLOL|nr:helix-turn-helix psq domain [Holotrichia oblita]
MPKVKSDSKYKKIYTEEALQSAVTDIENGMPKKQAARKYGIPRQTLQHRLSDKFKKIGHGPSTYLTRHEEAVLEEWIIDSYRKGFPRRRDDIQSSVKTFLDANPRKTLFKENQPGRHWYEAFFKRHPNLTLRTPEAVTKASSCVSERDIKNWFSNIENYLKEKHYFDILRDPTRVLNGDETCFLFCPKEDKVVAPRGAKNVYQVDQGTAKANITKQTSGPATAVGTGNVMESCELTYDDFVSIVGPEKLNQIKRFIEYREKNDKSEDFQLLVKIFQKITKLEAAESWSSGIDDSHNTVQCDDEDCESHQNNDLHCEARCAGGYEAPVPYFTEENIRGMEIVFGDSLLTQDQVEKVSHTLTKPNSDDNDLATFAENLEFENAQHHISENEENADPTVPYIDESNESLKVGSASHVQYTTTNKDDSIVKGVDRGLREALVWQLSPERKFQRKTQRMPYVITSSGWKKIHEEKEEVKREKEKKKEENRIKRK